jgi:hypothetical protein
MPTEVGQRRSVVRPLPGVGSDELVVGENDGAGCQFVLVDIFELRDRGRTSVGLVGGFVFEDEQMHELGWVLDSCQAE